MKKNYSPSSFVIVRKHFSLIYIRGEFEYSKQIKRFKLSSLKRNMVSRCFVYVLGQITNVGIEKDKRRNF
jgi:hypothetical protein